MDNARRLTQRDFDRFAGLSRDDNPIHCDPCFAARSGFGATVAHGMFLYGLICAQISRIHAAPWLASRQSLMFPAPTYAGDTVRVRVGAPSGATGATSSSGAHGATGTCGAHGATGTCGEGGEGGATGEIASYCSVARAGAEVETCVALTHLFPDPDPHLFPDRDPDAGARAAAHDTVEQVAHDAPRGVAPRNAREPCHAPPRSGDVEQWHGIALGQSAQADRMFNVQDLDEYSDLCGDRNPLVTDLRAANAAGYEARLVPGPLLCAMFSDLLGTRLPGRGTGWMKLDARFARPVRAGEALSARVEVLRLRSEKKLVDLRCTIELAGGEMALDARSLVLVRDLRP